VGKKEKQGKLTRKLARKLKKLASQGLFPPQKAPGWPAGNGKKASLSGSP
jgi:hypothetical protein